MLQHNMDSLSREKLKWTKDDCERERECVCARVCGRKEERNREKWSICTQPTNPTQQQQQIKIKDIISIDFAKQRTVKQMNWKRTVWKCEWDREGEQDTAAATLPVQGERDFYFISNSVFISVHTHWITSKHIHVESQRKKRIGKKSVLFVVILNQSHRICV